MAASSDVRINVVHASNRSFFGPLTNFVIACYTKSI